MKSSDDLAKAPAVGYFEGTMAGKKQTIGKGRPGPGRPKGVPNRTTTLLKDAILKAAEESGGGGPDGLVAYLMAQSIENPGPFMSLLGKVLPMQVNMSGSLTTASPDLTGLSPAEAAQAYAAFVSGKG